MAKSKIGILFSGGLESTSLISHYVNLGYSIYPVYIKYGYIWEEAELFHAQKIIEFYNLELSILDYSNILKVVQLGHVIKTQDNIIPLRNLSLFSFSSIYFFNKNISQVAIGLQGSQDYPDTSLEYIKTCEQLIKKGLPNNKFSIETPLYGMNKKKIFKKYHTIPIKLVFSCTNPINNERCHSCYKCKLLDEIINEK